ncbi:MAG: DNRLRE domain-containing protein [Acidimicrobiia bacterium]
MRFTTGRRTSLAVVFGVLVAVLPSLVDSSVAAPALADTACPAPTLTPDDPRAQWVEGTMALDDGATRDFYNRAAQLAWDNFMGDWADVNGTPQGSVAYATASLPDDDTPGPHTWNVTSLVREWLSGTPNQGFMLRQVGGAGPFDFYSKEHPVSAERPKLTVNTSTGTVTLEPEADTHLDSSTYQGFGDETRLRISENPTLIRFDLSALPAGATVNSATLQLWSYAEYGSSALEVGVFRVFHDPGSLPAARNGLAHGYNGDAGIGGNRDVYVYTTFTDTSWGDVYANADSPNVALVSSAPGFEPLDGPALKVTIPAGENTGMSAAYKFADQTGSEPEEIYFRYYLRIDQSWDPTYGGKFPGISGTYGIAGWGGRQSDGTNGWSARGLYQPTVTGSGNPLDDTVPVGSYVYHAEQPTQYGDNVLWQDGYLGYLEKDRWYSIEQHLVLNTPGVNDGILETWIDGRLAYRQTNWRWRDVDSLKIEQIWLDFYHGGTDVPDHDISLYIDNVVIARSYIGPMTGAPCAPTSGTFIDDDGSVFEPDIEKIAYAGITKGCNPPVNDKYCPADTVTRGQMAAFLVRALDLPPGTPGAFTDDDGSVFEANIEALAAAGITRGCNPPVNDKYCPTANVTREQMAAFLVRGLGLTANTSPGFVDTTNSIFQTDIEKLATAGITKGCNPPVNDRFCPTNPVTRGQMAAFLSRALGL